MKIMGIDPGSTDSAYVVVNENYEILAKGKIENEQLLELIKIPTVHIDEMVIEMIANMGMGAVGATIFDTCVWIGRFWEASQSKEKSYIYRREEKINLCGTMKAKDTNIRQALIDRFGVVGTKNNQGFFYGFKADMWAAFAVAVTYLDKKKEDENGCRKNN